MYRDKSLNVKTAVMKLSKHFGPLVMITLNFANLISISRRKDFLEDSESFIDIDFWLTHLTT